MTRTSTEGKCVAINTSLAAPSTVPTEWFCALDCLVDPSGAPRQPATAVKRLRRPCWLLADVAGWRGGGETRSKGESHPTMNHDAGIVDRIVRGAAPSDHPPHCLRSSVVAPLRGFSPLSFSSLIAAGSRPMGRGAGASRRAWTGSALPGAGRGGVLGRATAPRRAAARGWGGGRPCRAGAGDGQPRRGGWPCRSGRHAAVPVGRPRRQSPATAAEAAVVPAAASADD